MEIDFIIKYQDGRDKTYYHSLLQKKLVGETLDFDAITEPELKRLFWDELINRNQIAELFDVSVYHLDKKKKQLDVMESRYRSEELMEQFKKFQELTNETNEHKKQVETGTTTLSLIQIRKRLVQAFVFGQSDKEMFSQDEILTIIREVFENLENE